MQAFLAPISVAIWWSLYVAIFPTLQIDTITPHHVATQLALLDAICAIVAYGIGSAILASHYSNLGKSATCLALMCFSVMASLETATRLFGVVLSLNQGPMAVLASVCPFGIIGYSLWPEVGILLGLLCHYFILRKSSVENIKHTNIDTSPDALGEISALRASYTDKHIHTRFSPHERRATNAFFAPLIVAVWWGYLFHCLLTNNTKLTLFQLYVDTTCVVMVYGISSAILASQRSRFISNISWMAFVIWTIMGTFETLVRYINNVAPSSIVASAFPFGDIGYAACPLVGCLCGLLFTTVLSHIPHK